MKDKNSFTVFNDEGKEIECDVLFTFDSEETNKSYIVKRFCNPHRCSSQMPLPMQ